MTSENTDKWNNRWKRAASLLEADNTALADASTHSVNVSPEKAAKLQENYYERVRKKLRKIFGEIVKVRPDSVIDIGCGTGHWMEFYAKEYDIPVDRMTGVDCADAPLEFVRRRIKGVHLIKSDISKLDLDRPYFVANAIGVLHHLTKREELESFFASIIPFCSHIVVFPVRTDEEEKRWTDSNIKSYWRRQEYVDALNKAAHSVSREITINDTGRLRRWLVVTVA